MNQKIALFVVVATAIVAIAGFLLVSFLFRPLGATDGWITEQRLVGDVVVNVAYDPAKQVALVSAPPELPEPPAPELPTPESTATATPTISPTVAAPPTDTSTDQGGTGNSGTTDGTTTDNTAGNTGSGTNPGSPGPTVGAVQEFIFVPYTVGPNDTLYSVAASHVSRGMITSVALMARFGIGSTQIVSGNTINVPVANPDYCPGLKPYVVLEGDNAFRIAQRAGIPVSVLGQINNMDAQYTVYVTEVICLP